MRSLCLVAVLMCCLACSKHAPEPQPAPTQSPQSFPVGDGPRDFPGLHNVIRVSEALFSGSVPEGDDGFRSVKNLGILTIVTVDGANPDVDRARNFDLRYVHLPISYDGVPRDQALRIARAVRDLPGPVYLHCHHGKHRSPAAAAAATLCLDGNCSAERALGWLTQAGTAPHYKGLYASVHEFKAVSNADLDQVSAEFPETAEVGRFVETMVDIDTRWDHLRLIRAAEWTSPPKHPDLDPAHEALLLREGFRESTRVHDTKERNEEMRAWLREAEKNAEDLEKLLRTGPVDGKLAEAAWKRAAADCTRCHDKYRDAPR